MNVDYEVILNSEHIKNDHLASNMLIKMNELFATPGSLNNPVLKSSLPFINMNGENMTTSVPADTSKFKRRLFYLIKMSFDPNEFIWISFKILLILIMFFSIS